MKRDAWRTAKEKHVAHAIALRLACAFFVAAGVTLPAMGSAADIAADALPEGGHVAAGTATIGSAQKDAAGSVTMTIDQTSSRAVIDWSSFNVGRDATVAFQTWRQDAAGGRIVDPTAMTLNRVAAAGGLSTIAGRITSTGVFVLQNPNGVLFADGASVDAAGIVVSTAALDADRFMDSGALSFAQDPCTPNAAIIVNGTLTAQTDVAQAKAALEAAFVNVGRPVGTAISRENNVIRIVADGDVQVGRAGRLQATSTLSYRDDATGEAVTRDGTIVLRADANADGLAAGGTAAHVVLENEDRTQVQARHVTLQFHPDGTDGKPDYVKGAEEAARLHEKYTVVQAPANGARRAPSMGRTPAAQGDVAMLVNTLAELQAIDSHLGGSYVLGADIHADGSYFSPIGSTSPFHGTFDGNGYRIFDLAVQGKDNVGLFSTADHATIVRTTLVDADIHGRDQVGGIVGWAKNGTILAEDIVRKRDGLGEGGTRMGTADNIVGRTYVGGVAGRLEDSTIRASQNGAAVIGEQGVGGLAGLATDSHILDSSNTGYTSVKTNLVHGQNVGCIRATSSNAGGLVGRAEQTAIGVEKTQAGTYNTGNVAAARNAGGLVGYLVGGSIQQAYNANVPIAGETIVDPSMSGKALYGRVTGTGMNTGGLVGEAEGGSRIERAYHAGIVMGKTNVGGVVGAVGIQSISKGTKSVTLSQVYSGDTDAFRVEADGTVQSAAGGAQVTGTDHVGGLIGMLDQGTVSQAYSVSRVTGDEKVTTGLLVGEQTRAGTLGTRAAEKVYYVRQDDPAGQQLIHADGLQPIGKSAKWLQAFLQGRTLAELTQPESLGWADAGGTLSRTVAENQTWTVTEGRTPRLRALVLPMRPSETGTDATGAFWPSWGRRVGDEWMERTYAFAIRDHHYKRLGMTAEPGLWTAPERVRLPWNDPMRFFTLEDTVLRPSGLSVFGGAQLTVAGTEPLLSGTTIATAQTDVIMEGNKK